MKSLIIALALLSNTALAAEIPVVLSMYLYTGSLGKMTNVLEKQLAARIVEKCGTETGAQVKNLSIVFQNGPLAGGSEVPLWATVSETNGVSRVAFPSHPQVVLTASLHCR